MSLYDYLNLSPLATNEEIKKSHKELMLKYHPDKNHNQVNSQDLYGKYLNVQRAFEILGNSKSRLEYDTRNSNFDSKMGPLQQELDLDEMDYDEELMEYSYDCRCGDKFRVGENELEAGIYGIECGKCSLCVRLLYSEIVE